VKKDSKTELSLLSRKPFFSADLTLPQDFLYQINANISSMWIWDHYSDRSFSHEGMRSFAGIRAFESDSMQFSYEFIPRNRI